jgi:hypothetical protein
MATPTEMRIEIEGEISAFLRDRVEHHKVKHGANEPWMAGLVAATAVIVAGDIIGGSRPATVEAIVQVSQGVAEGFAASAMQAQCRAFHPHTTH